MFFLVLWFIIGIPVLVSVATIILNAVEKKRFKKALSSYPHDSIPIFSFYQTDGLAHIAKKEGRYEEWEKESYKHPENRFVRDYQHNYHLLDLSIKKGILDDFLMGKHWRLLYNDESGNVIVDYEGILNTHYSYYRNHSKESHLDEAFENALRTAAKKYYSEGAIYRICDLLQLHIKNEKHGKAPFKCDFNFLLDYMDELFEEDEDALSALKSKYLDGKNSYESGKIMIQVTRDKL